MVDGLSDALRQMAEGEHSPPASKPSQPRQPRADATATADEVYDESGLHAGLHAAVVTADRDREAREPTPANASARMVKLLAALVLFVMGLIMAAIASWATMVLVGFEIHLADRPGASFVATGMLVAYPIAMLLLGTATVLVQQVLRDKRREAGYRR